MVEFVYHDPTSEGTVSPFDRVLMELVERSDVRIACPYISLGVLERIRERGTKWRILTDVEEWLKTYDVPTRERIYDLLSKHPESVRHVEGLHAKVVIGNEKALVGSANLTDRGFTRRTEMGVLLDDPDEVAELSDWFVELWNRSSPPDLDEVTAFLQTASLTPEPARNRSSSSISSTAPAVRASFSKPVSDEASSSEITKTDHNRLVTVVGRAPDPEWIDQYLDLLAYLLEETGLSSDDPRLVTSLPTANTIPVTINNRYVLTALRSTNRVGFILPETIDDLSEYTDSADHLGRFDPLYGENRERTPHYVESSEYPGRFAEKEFRSAWIEAAKRELDRAKRSYVRRHHRPVVCRAARRPHYREQVIRAAFG